MNEWGWKTKGVNRRDRLIFLYIISVGRNAKQLFFYSVLYIFVVFVSSWLSFKEKWNGLSVCERMWKKSACFLQDKNGENDSVKYTIPFLIFITV